MCPGRPASAERPPRARATRRRAGRPPGSPRLRCGTGRRQRGPRRRPLFGRTRPRCSRPNPAFPAAVRRCGWRRRHRPEFDRGESRRLPRGGRGRWHSARSTGSVKVSEMRSGVVARSCVRLRFGGGEGTGRGSTLRWSVAARSQQGGKRDDSCQAGGPGMDRAGAMPPSGDVSVATRQASVPS